MKNVKTNLMLIVLGFIVLTSFTKKERITTSCIATWYDMHGRISASGVRMHRDSATCAYNALPMGTKLLITNTQNNKQCVAVITDRMGNKTPNRIDLSYKAFGNIANHKQGVVKVKITKLN
jgi:rare lipoprotein A